MVSDYPEPNGWEEDEAKQKEWTRENLKERQRMMELLSEFYENRSTPLDARLVFDPIGAYGGFYVQSMGAETMELLDEKQMTEKANLYKKEMEDFTAFLKNKFFQS